MSRRLVRTAWATAIACVGAAAQQPPQQQESPAPVAAPEAEVERATALLRAHAARCQGVQAVVADYVQRRSTALLKEPLVSKGEFLFVRDPGVVVFFAREPRVSTVRLAATTYEVWRPQKQQLERFHLAGPELAQGLFAVLGGDADRLLRDFVVVQCADRPGAATGDRGEVVVRLVPKDAVLRARVPEIAVTLRGAAADLCGVGYTDHAGDRIAIELAGLRRDPPLRPRDVIDVPKGATVVEHRVGTAPK